MNNTKNIFINRTNRRVFWGKKYNVAVLGIGVIVFTLLGALFFNLQNPKVFQVTFFDVGQGDAALISSPLGKKILIDTGLDGRVIARKISEYIPWYSNYLDIIILTHMDADHMGGAERIMREYDIGMIVMPYIPNNDSFMERIAKYNIPVIFVEAGESIYIEEGLVFDILWPIQEAS